MTPRQTTGIFLTSTQPTKFVYAVVGSDRFLRTLALEELLSKLSGDSGTFDPTHVDGESAELADVLDEVRTGSLLGDLRMVVVENADAFFTALRAKTRRKQNAALERYCTEPSSTGVLVFSCQSLAATMRIYKIIKKQGVVLKVDVPSKQAMGAWVVQRSTQVYDKRLSGAAASALRQRIGDVPGLLDAELAKLATYVGNRPEITPKDIGALTGSHREEMVFGVLDAILSGETGKALSLWEQVLATDRSANSPKSVGGLAFALRKWLQARRLVDGGRSVSAALQDVWIPDGHRHLSRISTISLEVMQRDLLTAELSTRSGLSDVRTAIEKWIVTCGATRAVRAAG